MIGLHKICAWAQFSMGVCPDIFMCMVSDVHMDVNETMVIPPASIAKVKVVSITSRFIKTPLPAHYHIQ